MIVCMALGRVCHLCAHGYSHKQVVDHAARDLGQFVAAVMYYVAFILCGLSGHT